MKMTILKEKKRKRFTGWFRETWEEMKTLEKVERTWELKSREEETQEVEKKEQWYKGEKEWNIQKKKGDRNKRGRK